MFDLNPNCFYFILHFISQFISSHFSQGEMKPPPPTQNVRASHETVVLSKTLQTLYMIVKSANIAFFAGDLDYAYTILVDALSLFRRLDNKKAIGIASNNLGNTLLSVYREMKMIKKDEIDGLTINDAITQGISHFHTAIKLGEKAYDEFHEIQGWSPICLSFMQHLANRYFNRGMFLLIVKNDHNDPKEIEKLGMRDLKIADDMDQEIVAYGEDAGWGGSERVDIRFNVNIIRIRGYNTLLGLGYDDNDNDWGVQELIQDTLGIIKDEYRKSQKSNLFTKMSPSGRLQELELQLMRYKLHHNDLETAAKIAVRLLVEDEYVFVEAIRQAVKVLIQCIETDDNNVEVQFRETMMPVVLKEYLGDLEKIMIHNREVSISETRTTSSSIIPLKSTSIRLSDHTTLSGIELSGIFVTMEDF
jgi:hypothetical protein